MHELRGLSLLGHQRSDSTEMSFPDLAAGGSVRRPRLAHDPQLGRQNPAAAAWNAELKTKDEATKIRSPTPAIASLSHMTAVSFGDMFSNCSN
jgi:hypothetical protein